VDVALSMSLRDPQPATMNVNSKKSFFIDFDSSASKSTGHTSIYSNVVNCRTLDCLEPKRTDSKASLTEDEKGSDVNLASHLLMDGFNKSYDTAIVISNDSDLFTPVKMVRDELKNRVIVANPQERVSMHLRSAATFVSQIRQGVLIGSQFPPITPRPSSLWAPNV
jgi:hypothetical protein